jgi:hypothetical protein
MTKKLTSQQLDILYECWKEADNTKDRLKLIEQKLPKVAPLIALNIMRKKAKIDPKWIGMATRKQNKIEKEKTEKQLLKEKKKKEREQKKQEREQNKLIRLNKQKEKENLNKIKIHLKQDFLDRISNKIKSEFFFCSTVQCFVNNISCIYRVFSDEYNIYIDSSCEKCKKMDKYLELIEEIINEEQNLRRNSISSRDKNKKERKADVKKTRTISNTD